jgi:hypothetical protein
MLDASNGWVDTPANVETVAVSLVLRDMGNGVNRVLSIACVAGQPPPSDFFELFAGTIPVPLPLSERLRDALDYAVACCELAPPLEYAGGFMRPLTDDITEFFLW